jgi:hypothetical protein
MATRYQRGIQKPYAQGYTTQWPHNTKGVFRSRKPKDIQHNDHKILKGYSGAVSRMIYNTMATSEYSFSILWSLCCISFGLRLLNTPLVLCGHCVVYPCAYGLWIPLWYLVAIVLYILRFTASEYPFGILWPLCCISFELRFLNTPLVSCGHCVYTMATRYQRDIQKP